MTLSAEQIQQHRECLSASSAASALGLNPFESPLEYWAKLTGRVPWDDPDETEKSKRDKAIGHQVEPLIAREFESRMGLRVKKNGVTKIHKKHDWLIGTPDYYILGETFASKYPGGLECKNVGPNMRRYWGDEDDPSGVPVHVVPQVACYALITGIRQWFVAAYFGGSDFRVYELNFEGELLEKLERRLANFWDLVVSGNTPQVSHIDIEILSKMYAGDPGKTLVVGDSDDLMLDVQMCPEHYKDVADSQKRLDLCKVRIQSQMGEATTLTDPEGKPLFTWKRSKDRKPKTNWKDAFYDLASMTIFNEEKIIDIEKRHTKPGGPGNRPFLCKFKDEVAT